MNPPQNAQASPEYFWGITSTRVSVQESIVLSLPPKIAKTKTSLKNKELQPTLIRNSWVGRVHPNLGGGGIYTVSVGRPIMPNPPKIMCFPLPPQSTHTMALRRQSDTDRTNFPWSNFTGKTIIPCSVEICYIMQYNFLPILFVALILILDFLNSHAVHPGVNVKSA